MKITLPAILIAMFFCNAAFSQTSKVRIERPPFWINPIEFDKDATPPVGQESGFYYLLVEEQENTSLQERYFRYAYKVLTNEGIQTMSDLSVEYDPAYQTLSFHNVRVHRNGKIINQLPASIKTIQREERMDRYLYDGSLTAVLNLTDIRVGDIIEYSFTYRGYNPVYDNHISKKIYLNFSSPYERLYQRLIVSQSSPIDIEYRHADIKPDIRRSNGQVEYVWSLKGVKAQILDNNVPYWYDGYQRVMITDFKSWREVALWATKHFQTLPANRQRLKESMPAVINDGDDDETKALNIIRFVQDEVRYLGFESGLNSHKPHAPEKVLDQRYGDCKDKSLLLCEMLRVHNIEAAPVLVNSVLRNKLADELPSITAFNHCVVQLKVNNRFYHIDPTISNQGGSLETWAFPTYGKGLVVHEDTQALIDFPEPVISEISEVQTFGMADLNGEAILNIRTTYTGSEADYMRGQLLNSSLEAVQKNYLTFYANIYPDLEVLKPISFQDNRDGNIFSMEENYRIPTFWKTNEAAQDLLYCDIYPLSLENYFRVDKSSARTTPYALVYPVSYHHYVHIKVPREWSLEPDNKLIETDFYNYEFLSRYSDKEITLQTHYETKQNFIPLEAFNQFVSDHEVMMNNLGFQLSYNKNIVANESGISWMAIVVAFISLAFGIWLCLRLFYYYDPEPKFSSLAGGLNIGGWLILPAIGLLVTPLRLVYDLYQMPHMYDSQTWANLLALERYALYAFILLEHVYNIIQLPFSILVLVLFIKRRSSLPRMIMIYYAVTCFVTIVDTIVSNEIGTTATEQQSFTQNLVRSIVAAAIWIPYFHLSDRVKETFVNRVNDDDDNSLFAAEVSSPYPGKNMQD